MCIIPESAPVKATVHVVYLELLYCILYTVYSVAEYGINVCKLRNCLLFCHRWVKHTGSTVAFTGSAKPYGKNPS